MWAGEGLAAVPWPDENRKKVLRRQLTSLIRCLEKEHLKWKHEVLDGNIKEQEQLEAAKERLRRLAEEEGAMDEVIAT